jgi:hypothetical protein
MTMGKIGALLSALTLMGMGPASWSAQQPPQPPVRTPREAAQTDLTGYWVAQVTEDWRWRMMTPPKGDHESVPLNAAGLEVTNNWDLDRDNANGDQCKAYGAGAIMRLPTRIRITWENDHTLKLETDAGQQIRFFNFEKNTPPPANRTLQGHSLATWMRPANAPPPGGLKVVTTHLLPGYLRKNGVPYSENAVVTEHYQRVNLHGGDYLHVQTIVEDPTYLTVPMVISNHFKREPDGSKWNPTPCTTDPPAVAVAPPSAIE